MNKIGIDVGGTKIQGIVIDNENNIKQRKKILAEPQKGYSFIVESITDLIQDLKDTKKDTVGIGIPGIFSSKSGTIEECNISCMQNQFFKHDIEQKMKQEIRIENDANCFTLAESILGGGRTFDIVLGITIGTGIGAGLCMNKKLYKGKHDASIEFGHTTLYPNSRYCYCGKNGCVESYISGTSLEGRWRELTGISEKIPAIIKQMNTSSGSIWKRDFLKNFGISLGNLVHIFDPEIIILGGGLSNISFLYDEGKNEVISNLFDNQKNTPITKADFGDFGGAVGACLLHEKLGYI